MLFPMPYDIAANSLKVGDVHKVDFRYYRWFVTNVHEGSMQLVLSEVNDNYIRARFVSDTSYIANYIQLRGSEIVLEPLTTGKTKVTIRIQYHRFLDPVWYFGPLQEYAIGE